MSLISDASSPPLALPKLKKFDVQEYVSFLAQLAKVDAHLVLPELHNNAAIYSFEDEATYQAHLANSTYFSTELVLADPLPISANLDGIELDDWAEILDATAGPYSDQITATNSRFRTDAAQDATFMDAGVSVFFDHLFIQAPGAGRLSLRTYLDRLYPYGEAALRTDRAQFIRRTIDSFYQLELSTLSSRVTIEGVDYQALAAAGTSDRRSRYFGQPLNFLALGHTVQTRTAGDDFFDTVSRVSSLDHRLCFVLDRLQRRCERILVVIADQHSHFSIRQLHQRQRKAVGD